MNIERLAAVRQAILDEPKAFNMHILKGSQNGRDCKTIGCVAGMADYLYTKMGRIPVAGTATRATSILDLTEPQADMLFYGWTIHDVSTPRLEKLRDSPRGVWGLKIGGQAAARAGARWIDTFVLEAGTPEEYSAYQALVDTRIVTLPHAIHE